MKKLIISLIAALSLQACSNGSGTNTELEGNWESICIHVLNISGPTEPLPFPPPPLTTSNRIVISFAGNTTGTKVNTYADRDCTILETSIPLAETAVSNPDGIFIRFEIGDTLITSNGVTVRELDYFNANDDLTPEIYLLQDNGTTLYFGKRCYSDGSGSGLVCSNDRPTELYYDFYYTKKID